MHCARLAPLAALTALLLVAPACGGDDDAGSSPDGGADESDASPPEGPACGDGATEGAEACDDGNEADGDGCSATCDAARCLVPVTHESIQDALDDADCPDVWVMPGTYQENLTIERDVAVEGTGAGEVIVDAGGGRGVDIDAGVVRLTGFTVQNGAAASGAGLVTNGFVVMNRMRVIDNVASGANAFGGGIRSAGTLFLDDVEVSGNTATNGDVAATQSPRGGGIYATGVLIVTNGSRIHANTARVTEGAVGAIGGGILGATGANVIITGGSSVTDNVAEAEQPAAVAATAIGGGVSVIDADSTVLVRGGAVIDGNRARATSATGTASATGGGVACTNGAASIILTEGVRVSDNRVRADGGGGSAIALGGGVGANVCGFLGLSSRIAGNRATSENATSQIVAGGGLFVTGASAGLSAMTIADNAIEAGTSAVGGGIAFIGADGLALDVIGSTVSGNTATADAVQGGGVYANQADAGVVTFTNSTVSGNSVDGDLAGGGAVYTTVGSTGDDSSIRFFNTTVTENTAVAGGGLVLDAAAGATLTTVFASSIVHGNTADTSPETACSGGGAPVLTSTQGNVWGDTTGCTGAGNFATDSTEDPELGPLADNGGATFTHTIGAGGSAVDGGDPDGCVDANAAPLLFDQRGEPRPAGPECDSGAVERQ
ncbi:MAG TPA: choice-of-anchor Q domain-containing protein [Kofleriaceae bacterium]|nr:choice-of-anchor Q domain-containing protein [Kofleriaceae bacterium]